LKSSRDSRPKNAQTTSGTQDIAQPKIIMLCGGLSKATQRKLAALTKELAATGHISPAHDIRLRPGARLVREWRGRAHTIVVTEDGFEYAGKIFSSLTTIAGVITGAHWSGPRFFGLNRSGVSDDHLNDSHADEEPARE
jgi:hypothetical protein